MALSHAEPDAPTRPSRRAGRRLLAVLGAALALSAPACSDTGRGTYSYEVRANFLAACEAGGAGSEYCHCFLEYMEARTTEREFLRIEARLETEGTADQVLYDAFEECH